MNKKKLQIARNKIDQLDKKIFYLIKKRTSIVKYMLSLKGFKKQIIDHKRIKEILKKIKNQSIKNRIDPKITSRIWKSIIWSYVDFQRRNFRKK
jgi:chorismate mutase